MVAGALASARVGDGAVALQAPAPGLTDHGCAGGNLVQGGRRLNAKGHAGCEVIRPPEIHDASSYRWNSAGKN